jgi:hypothetical protein
MPFTIRPYRRVPVQCPVTYHVGDFEGHGTLWNCSRTGWRFSGNLPLREGEIFSLTVTLPSNQRVYVVAAIVCWVRGEDYGADTLTMDDDSREALEQYINHQLDDWMESHW